MIPLKLYLPAFTVNMHANFLSAHQPHVVRFASSTLLEPEPLHVAINDQGILEAHIGMLRSHHTYRIEIPRTHTLGPQITASHPQANIYVQVTDVSDTKNEPDGNFTNVITCQVKTIKDGSIAENIIISAENDDTKREEVLVTAKVLDITQGNPVLKTGVHVVSHELTEETMETEWPDHGKSGDDDD